MAWRLMLSGNKPLSAPVIRIICESIMIEFTDTCIILHQARMSQQKLFPVQTSILLPPYVYLIFTSLTCEAVNVILGSSYIGSKPLPEFTGLVINSHCLTVLAIKTAISASRLWQNLPLNYKQYILKNSKFQ